jgi:Ca2+-binding RTX toxin-like protein
MVLKKKRVPHKPAASGRPTEHRRGGRRHPDRDREPDRVGFQRHADCDGNNNVLTGGTGNEILAGGLNGVGGDTASYATATAKVTVSLLLQGGAQNTVGGGVDTLAGIENLIGSAFNDTLTGSGLGNVLAGGAGNDVINGKAGNDTLQGGADDDILIGGAGSDALDGGAGNDTASYATSTAAVTVDLNAGTGLGGDAQSTTTATGLRPVSRSSSRTSIPV